MTPTDASPAPLRPPVDQVELALAGIENSAAFRSSARHRALLRYLVAHTLADDPGVLKESVIAVEVFGRPPSRFNPQADSIVRVEARRLRARLASYYRAEGRHAPIRIDLPVGSYVPLIAAQAAQRHTEAATRRARDLVERGEHFLREALSPATLEQALARFDEAQRESPTYAPACVGLARAWLNLATGWYREPAVAADHAGEALRRALELAPDDATAHALLGAIQHQFERHWTEARRSFERAVALGTRQAFVHSAYGYHLVARSEFAAAERELLLARQLDPQYVNSRMHIVNLRIAQGRLAQAEVEIEAMRDIAPGSMAVVGMCGSLAMFRRDAPAALVHYRRACELAPDHPGCFAAYAAAQALAGDVAGADATMAEVQRRFADRILSPYMCAIVETRCGRLDAALRLIEDATRGRDPNLMFLSLDPSFEALHAHPRWPAVHAAALPVGAAPPSGPPPAGSTTTAGRRRRPRPAD
jgi:Flp pilus assembly protein TadD